MEQVILSAIPRKYIIEYLEKVSKRNEFLTHFYGDSWEVDVFPEILRKLHQIQIPQTKVVFRANQEVLDQIVNDFRLKFLSAGG